MSDEIKAGDRFEWKDDGDAWAVTDFSPDGRVATLVRERDGYSSVGYCVDTLRSEGVWRRLPRDGNPLPVDGTQDLLHKYTKWLGRRLFDEVMKGAPTVAPAVCLTGCAPIAPCRSHVGCPALREDAIAARMAERTPTATPSPRTSRPYQPSPSGLGSMVGPVLSQRAR